ncbi:hypothetical protein COU57_03925 [Candidatus Pacearchaeota archaeon CG10_big_fil_rev_8_21_14_0_10_32_14]|nr:MAG: hypothetical protein COU57_03925 [Candidatus Pacearchaeota archaeon CG10_big_fil_rev_8_21_14_0_10_32_14]
MDLKSILSEWKIQESIGENTPFLEYKHVPFLEVFGRDNMGFVTSVDVIKESRTGERARVYKMNEKCVFYPTDLRGIETKLVFAEEFDLDKVDIFSREDLIEIYNHLELLQRKGDIGLIVNSKKSALYEDKLSFIEFREKGFPMINTYHFDSFSELERFLGGRDGNFLLKHRFGLDGRMIYRGDKNYLLSLKDIPIDKYILQPELKIASEKRMIFFGDDLIASRIILDRTRPWETKGERRHETLSYRPTKKEKDLARRFFKYVDGTVGCVDTIQLYDGREYILEFNGTATGYGSSDGYVYDCNGEVAERLRDMIHHG